VESPAWGLNQLCGRACAAVAWAISAAKRPIPNRGRRPARIHGHGSHDNTWRRRQDGSVEVHDTMIQDGLWDASTATTWHTAENVAKQYQITPASGRFAVASQKSEAAQKPQVQGRDRRSPSSPQGDIIVSDG